MISLQMLFPHGDTQVERVGNCKKIVQNSLKRLQSKLNKQRAELAIASDWILFQQIADSLLGPSPVVSFDRKQCTLINVHSQEQQLVILNPKLSLIQNAQLYYKKAKKGKRSKEQCLVNVQESEKSEALLKTLISLCDAFLEAQPNDPSLNANHITEIENLIEKLHSVLKPFLCIPKVVNSDKFAYEETPFRHYILDNWHIFIGRNDAQNDELTTRFSKPSDIWLHVAAHAGSHVLIRRNKNDAWPPKDVLEKVAGFAVFFSKAKHTSYAEVHLTEARYVSKPRKAPPGEVRIQTYKTLRVSPLSPLQLFKDLKSEE